MAARHACLACAQSIPGSEVALSVTGSVTGSVTRSGTGAQGREPVCDTGRLSAQLEDVQFTLGEGPAPDALATGGPVLATDLSAPAMQSRWPAFTREAAAAGIRAVFAFPLQVGAVRIGVLAVYRTCPGPLSRAECADALDFADAALELLLDARSGISPDERTGWDEELGSYRAQVHQATGMISAQLEVGVEEALLRLRAYAFAHGKPISTVAHDVVTRRLRFAAESDSTGHS